MADISMLNHLIRILRDKHTEPNNAAHAAVAILLTTTDSKTKLLLVKRATRENDPWSGHMAFPGGRRGKEDIDLKTTAIRETWEETGIDLSKCVFIGCLDSIHSTVKPDMCIQPYVFTCAEIPDITLNEELIAFYWINLEDLDRSQGFIRIEYIDHPAYIIEEEVVWGLTFRMLKRLIKILNN
jgi:8-oxo-dGTP pyrophosphatase MutT (NUDIX family)